MTGSSSAMSYTRTQNSQVQGLSKTPWLHWLKWDKWQLSHLSPMVSLLLVLLAIGCMGASACIVVLADNDLVTEWVTSPTVLLAITSSIVNVCLATLLSFGVAIVWWRSASRGTTLESLYLIWDRGMGFTLPSALLASPDARKVAIAAILVAVAKSANGPLLQKAIRTTNKDIPSQSQLKIAVAKTIADGALGTRKADFEPSNIRLSGNGDGSSVFRSWYFNSSLWNYPPGISSLSEFHDYCRHQNDTTCGGYVCPPNSTCRGKLHGAGLACTCSNSTLLVNLLDQMSIGDVVFRIAMNLHNSTTDPGLILSTQYVGSTDDSCVARIVLEKCLLQAAIVEYPIKVNGMNIEPDMDLISENPKFLSPYKSDGDLLHVLEGTDAGPLSGMLYYFARTFMAKAVMETPTSISSDSPMADLFWRPGDGVNANCSAIFEIPTNYITGSMRTFMFYATVLTSGEDVQMIDIEQIASTVIFITDLRFLIASLATLLSGLLSIVVILWDWWGLSQLGVTLSPIETARAFAAPLLEGRVHAKDVDGILREVGHLRVRYDSRHMIEDAAPESELSLLRHRVPEVGSRQDRI